MVLQFNTIKTFAQVSAVTTGQDAKGAGGEVSWSVGQVLYSTFLESGGVLSQGVQQPFELYTISETDDLKSSLMRAYPNPASNSLIISTESQLNGNLKWQLFNLEGSVLLEEIMSESITRINIESFQSGIYFLKISENEKIVKHFKVIKQ